LQSDLQAGPRNNGWSVESPRAGTRNNGWSNHLGQPEERVFLQGKQALSYQVECFGGAVLNSSTYDKELYPPVQAMNKWVEARIG
jgi:hypothetical protein